MHALLRTAVVYCTFLLASVLFASEQPVTPLAAEPVVYFDLTPSYKLNLNNPAERRRFWDECHLVFALQGLVNRSGPRLYVRFVSKPDDFWWDQMVQSGGWLSGRKIVRVSTLEQLLTRFAGDCDGAVVWDEAVPATSNLASTIAGCDNLLPLRYDPTPGSLYRQLTEHGPKLQGKVWLVKGDGSSLFTGQGTIPGTAMVATGSAKCDAYYWLIHHYVKTGKANPQRMGYYLDAFWLRSWKASGPENHTLSNHDFVIARKGVLFDLNVWDDEACVDDPAQRPGTDARTLRSLLRAAYDQFRGQGMIHVAGFVPWAFKYTAFKNAAGSAGGTHEPVPTEWKYAEILSCFNAFMDADALGLSAMANASFYQHYPLAPHYPQQPRPTRKRLRQRGLLDAQGRIAPRHYLAHYVGDYDAAAWLYRELPRMWRDPARGTTALSWAFNPNLSERFPLGMAWARERSTSNDWFVAGDSGAGYLNPGYLTPPRPHSGLPSGLAAWEQHCREFYRKWDITVTGFVIDGFARGLDQEGLDAYARFSPDGMVAQQIPRQGVHAGMPFLRMRTDLDGSPAQVAESLHSLASGSVPQFMVCRSILKTPAWYAQVESELAKRAGDRVQVVDLYTLLWLVREFETNRAHHADPRYAQAQAVQARPGELSGLAPLLLTDGAFQTIDHAGQRCWRVPKRTPAQYLYFDVNDAFPANNGAMVIELEYWDEGAGRVLLEYDSGDARAPHAGAYKPHAQVIHRTASRQWRTASFHLPDARFAGNQNGGADFRFYNGGEDLFVRAVSVRKVQ